jgi:hypothetical protein
MLLDDLFPILHIAAVFASHWVCRSSNARYTQLSERHTQWDTKTAAIYKLGSKSSYKMILQHQN